MPGDLNNNVISVSVNTAGGITVARDNESLDFDAASVKRIYVDVGDGDDSVVNSTKLRGTLLGGNGNDKLLGGKTADSLYGAAGDDVLYGRAGNDSIDGGSGNDTMLGGDGLDTADFFSSSSGFAFVVGPVPNEPAVPPDFEGWTYARSGTEIDNVFDVFERIAGTLYRDRFELQETHGGGYFGRAGNDLFVQDGGMADGDLFGDAGDDTFFVDEGDRENVFGGSGDDRLLLNEFAQVDSFDGGPGADAIDMSEGRSSVIDLNSYMSVENVINLGLGSLDTPAMIIGTDGPNFLGSNPNVGQAAPGVKGVTILGGGGDDTIFGMDADDDSSTNADDSLDGGDGNDMIFGRRGNDTITGGAGNDTMDGGIGADSMDGGTGNDLIHGQDNTKDTIDGGANTDTADRDLIDDVRNIENFI